MRCPFCKAQDTKVVDSRLTSEGEQVRRRRKCLHCGGRFTTYETVELNLPTIIKRDGSRVPFDLDKVRGSMIWALERRPITREQVEAAINRIEKYLVARGEQEVSSQQIGELIMEELRILDKIAYVRFASVYQRFETLQDLRKEIDRLEQESLETKPDTEAS